MARFKEQPKHCSCWGCGNRRRAWGGTHPTMQEVKFLSEPLFDEGSKSRPRLSWQR
jgi:hypothetical protein